MAAAATATADGEHMNNAHGEAGIHSTPHATGTSPLGMTKLQARCFDEDGFFVIEDFLGEGSLEAMLAFPSPGAPTLSSIHTYTAA